LGITPPSEPPGYVSLSRSRGSKIYERITAYLSSRGISPERAEQVGIGYSPTYPLRFILPITYQNRIVHYLARAYDDSVQPKELSPRITDHKSQEYWPTRQWWPRRFVLYNYDSITPGGILVLTEGFFDCEAVLKSGVPSIALLGSVLTESQAGLILQKNPSAIIIAADGDSASVGFVQKALKQLYYRTPVPIKVADIPEGKDPDELSKEVLLDLIGKALFPSQWMVRATQRGWVRTDNQNWVKRTLFKEKKRGYIYRSGV
jgi:DNA primase